MNPKESTTCNVMGESAGSTDPNASMAKLVEEKLSQKCSILQLRFSRHT